ncbi:MAG: hypothetical protein L0I76_15725 [Pseudonocardia sp.]|nr:hypothetical protein [Pseudonocardia sp.]
MKETHAIQLIDRDDTPARRFWAILVELTSRFAIRAGVPVQNITGSPVLREGKSCRRRNC